MIDIDKLKVGDKVRRINSPKKDIEIGDVFTFTGRVFNGLTSDRNGVQIGYANRSAWEYVNDDEKVLSELESILKQVDELHTKAAKLVAQRKGGTTPRREVIKKAKADLEDLTERMADTHTMQHEGNTHFRHRVLKPEFHVNKKKEVVTVLVKGGYVPTLYEKAFAKCSPEDEFSEDIGKVIALRRALGLEVPNEYLNAPKY